MASRVFYGSGGGEAGDRYRQQYQPRRPGDPEQARERRPPQQLYVPPRHRQGGASSGFNRASSPGFSTCSEIVTSWRACATPPRGSSPGPLSPGSARPPTGPRRRHSQQAGDSGGAWRQSGEVLSQSRPSSRQGAPDAAGTGRRRSGRRRRRSGRRSRSQSEDRPASAAEPASPSPAPWRSGQRGSWDGGQPQRPPSPRGPARPRFQQPYLPPARRDCESPAPQSPPPPHHQRRPDWPSPAAHPSAGHRGRGGPAQQRPASPGPASPYHDYRRSPAPPQQPASGVRSPAPPRQPVSAGASPRRPAAAADEPGSTGSLGRRGSRRRRLRGTPDGGTAASPAPPRRSLSPTDLIASLQLESGPPQTPAGIAVGYRQPDSRPAGVQMEPNSPTDVMAHLGVRSSPLLPRTDSLGQLVNTTDDEKATLGGRGRGRGRPRRSPGPPAPGLPQSDEIKAALRRPRGQTAGHWAEPRHAKPDVSQFQSSLIVDSSRPGGSSASVPKPGCGVPSGQRGAESANTRPHHGTQPHGRQEPGSAAVLSTTPQPAPAVSSSSDAAAVVSELTATAPAPNMTTAEVREGTTRAADGLPELETAVSVAVLEPSSAASAGLAATDPGASAGLPTTGVEASTDPPETETSLSAAAPLAESAASSGPRATETDVAPALPASEAAVAVGIAVPEKSRRHSSASSGGGLFNLSLEEPFDWADEVDEWERRFNDEGDATDADAKKPRSPTKKRPSGGGGQGRPLQPDRPEPDEVTADPSLPAHVIELYNFPAGFSIQDFNMVFADFVPRGFDVRPVDDKHALAVFSSAACASEALRLCHPLLLSRPLSQASARSRQRARRPSAVQLPHRARPETSALHAGRMVATALGRHQPGDGRARQRRDQEKRRLRDARDKKRLGNKQKDDAWEGRF